MAVDYRAVLEEIADSARPAAGTGKVADYIPALAGADPTAFGFAVADLAEPAHLDGVGQWQSPFSIQSVSKAFTLALVLAVDGDALWT